MIAQHLNFHTFVLDAPVYDYDTPAADREWEEIEAVARMIGRTPTLMDAHLYLYGISTGDDR